MKKILALLAVSMVLAACESGPKIRSNTAPSANLAQYKTYTFAEKLGTDRGGVETPLTGYFKEAIRREMDARGYQFVAVGGTADLMVNVGANSRENVDVRSTPAPYVGGYYGYRGGMYGGWGYGGTEVDTVRYKVGTCNIDLVDMQKRQLVWEGIAEGKLTDKAMQDPRGTISAVVAEIFKQFPGPAGAPAAGSGG